MLLYKIIYYIFVATLISFLQCVLIELVKKINALFRRKKYFHYILVVITLLLLFLDFYLCSLIWASFLFLAGAFPTFHEAVIYAIDSFSTLGGKETPENDWLFAGPIIAVVGISCIAFITSTSFGVIAKDIEEGSLFSRL